MLNTLEVRGVKIKVNRRQVDLLIAAFNPPTLHATCLHCLKLSEATEGQQVVLTADAAGGLRLIRRGK